MKHTLSYIICATPRSGSTLLCDLLTESGVAGQPDSFFRRESFIEWAEYLSVSVEEWTDDHAFSQSYLESVLKQGTAGTEVFGMRLMWESIDGLLKQLRVFYPRTQSDTELLQSAFGPIHYVHLSRQDKVAQAVSHLRAEQSGLWHRHTDGSERERLTREQPLVFDRKALSRLVAESEEHDAAWNRWFDRHGIKPVRITYEKLSDSPKAILATILSALGQNPAIAEHVEPRTAKLADGESREWITRFNRE